MRQIENRVEESQWVILSPRRGAATSQTPLSDADVAQELIR